MIPQIQRTLGSIFKRCLSGLSIIRNLNDNSVPNLVWYSPEGTTENALYAIFSLTLSILY